MFGGNTRAFRERGLRWINAVHNAGKPLICDISSSFMSRPLDITQYAMLYAGAQNNLYTYKVYNDVRLVFGVEYQTGFFGGDPDNFTYPRYNLDVSMFRLYENDKPAQTPNYLKWSPAG